MSSDIPARHSVAGGDELRRAAHGWRVPGPELCNDGTRGYDPGQSKVYPRIAGVLKVQYDEACKNARPAVVAELEVL